MPTFIDTLNTLADAEQRFVAVVRNLAQLYDAGALQYADLAVYERLRGELYVAQLLAWGTYAYQIRSYLPPDVAAQVPVPQLAPNFPVRPNYGPGVTQPAPATTTAGLGVAPVVIAVGGLTIELSLFAVALLALLTAAIIGAALVAVVYAILGSQELDNAAARAQQDAQAVQQFYQARLACMQAGRTVADCTATIPLPTVVRPPATPVDPA